MADTEMVAGERSDAVLPDFASLPREQLEAMHDAAATVLECEHVLAKSGSNVVLEVLRDQGDFLIWESYPKGDVQDPETHSQYFYHSHTPDEMLNGENGHFHLFVRPAEIAPDMEPWDLPGAFVPEKPEARFVHLAAISVDGAGWPLRIFTTNRWVTNETLYRADDVIGLLDHFRIALARPNWAVNQWLNAMVVLYRPQIEALIRERDVRLEAWLAEHPDSDVLEDRDLQNTSEVRIDTVAQIGALERALGF
ncbi:hypothetical protein [Breoghania sp.]|uniref:DUF6969 family protein n=1 Tax=Breoghania sp. TaxID=2065378 RepID=UPI002AA95338|nr:hypothetical protein [Breoghania sp.]